MNRSESVILMDMDNTVFDFDAAMRKYILEHYPEIPLIETKDRTEFLFENNYPENLRTKIRQIYAYPNPGFFRNILPIEGAIESINEMIKEGINIRFCTYKLPTNPQCVEEKKACLDEYFEDRVDFVPTADKTLLDADILIDDWPDPDGSRQPSWQPVIYSQRWNEHFIGPRINNLTEWREIILPLLNHEK